MIREYQINFDNSLIDKIYELKKIDQGVKFSNIGGWHSTPFYKIPDWFESYAEVIQQTTDKIIHNFWFNINDPGHSNQWHTHGNNFDSIGVWYLQVPVNSGNFCLEANGKTEILVPYPSLFIVHLCGLNHSVSENLSNQSRISAAFNFCK